MPKLKMVGFVKKFCKRIKKKNSFYCTFLEGIREREKILIGTILKSISYIRDNTYNLNRNVWNDVHEDWPFYSEQDRQCLKRYN